MRVVLLMALVLTLLAPAASAGAQTTDRFAGYLDRHMPDLLERFAVPGTVVARISNGEVVWTRAYGLADTESAAPMRADRMTSRPVAGY